MSRNFPAHDYDDNYGMHMACKLLSYSIQKKMHVGSLSRNTWVKVSLKLIILAYGFVSTLTSSCFIAFR